MDSSRIVSKGRLCTLYSGTKRNKLHSVINVYRHIPTFVESAKWFAPLSTGSVAYFRHSTNALVVRLMGGMGNQMFQYATAKHVSHLTGREVYIDVSYLCNRRRGNGFVYRSYELDHFNVSSPLVFLPRFSGVYICDSDANLRAVTNSVESAIAKPVLLDGYWQDLQYIPSKESLREIFRVDATLSLPQVELLQQIHESESVMINVRRADFLNSDYHGIVGMDYFLSAVAYINSRVSNPRYFVFSDDVEWCRKAFDQDRFTVVGHEYAGESFTTYFSLMTNCKHFVIPNSTFAWWAAYLGSTGSSVVIRPSFFVKGQHQPESRLFSGLDWIVIEA